MRGVSPVVAVVLLIALTVIAGVGTWYWVGSYTSKPATISYSAYLSVESCDLSSMVIRNNGLTLSDKRDIPIFDSNNAQIGIFDLLGLKAGNTSIIYPRISNPNVTAGQFYFYAQEVPRTIFTCTKSSEAAISFDGVDDFVTMSPPKPSQPLTITFWAKPSNNAPCGMFDSGPGQTLVLRNYGLAVVEWWPSNPAIGLGLGGSNWYHFVFIYKNTSVNTLDHYLNGAFVSNASGSSSTDFAWTTPIRLGDINTGSACRFNGTLDNFIIYNRTLTATEINASYLGNPPIDSLIGYWKFDWNATDFSGRGNNGTVSSAMYVRGHSG